MERKIALSWYFGYNCNLRCDYCNLTKEKKNIRNDWKSIDKILKEYPDINSITLSGGEATLFRDECLEILKRFSEKYEIRIISNGTNLEILKEFLEYPVKIILSYDGHINERGYDCWDNLLYLYNIGRLDMISMVIGNSSYDKLYDTLCEIDDKMKGFLDDKSRLEINVARDLKDYYKIDYVILEQEIKKLYNRFPNLMLFDDKEKLCPNYYSWDNDHVCRHENGELFGTGCYAKFSDYGRINDIYYHKCYNCDNDICWGKFCPNCIDALGLEKGNNKKHPYCIINGIIDNVVKELKNKKYITELISRVEVVDIILEDDYSNKGTIDNVFNDIITKSTKKVNICITKNGKEKDKEIKYIYDKASSTGNISSIVVKADNLSEKELEVISKKYVFNSRIKFYYKCEDKNILCNLEKLIDKYNYPNDNIEIILISKKIDIIYENIVRIFTVLKDKYKTIKVKYVGDNFKYNDYDKLKECIENVYESYVSGNLSLKSVKGFLETNGNSKCGIGEYLLAVYPNGDVIPCYNLNKNKLENILFNINNKTTNNLAYKLLDKYSYDRKDLCPECIRNSDCNICKTNNTCEYEIYKRKLADELFGNRFKVFSEKELNEFTKDYEYIVGLINSIKDCEIKSKYEEVLSNLSLVFYERREYFDLCCD